MVHRLQAGATVERAIDIVAQKNHVESLHFADLRAATAYWRRGIRESPLDVQPAAFYRQSWDANHR